MNVSRYQCEATLFKQIVQLLIPVKQECDIIVSREQREKEIGEELEWMIKGAVPGNLSKLKRWDLPLKWVKHKNNRAKNIKITYK